MTIYWKRKTFTLPASAGTKATCQEQGHAWADQKGRCIRCGGLIRSATLAESVPTDSEGPEAA